MVPRAQRVPGLTLIGVLVVIGTRPEAIKLAPVVHELRRRSDSFKVSVCLTAQHRDMVDQVLSVFEIRPDFDLDLMSADQTLAEVTSRVVVRVDGVLKRAQPDWMLVQGDTTTVLGAALAAYYAGIRIGHVEAGLRTGDKRQPFPEEMNRKFTDYLADLRFAPTRLARDTLIAEGIPESSIVVTGNTVIDALMHAVDLAASRAPCGAKLPDDRRVVLVTMHRRESFGEPLLQVCQGLRTLAGLYGDSIHIVYPVHRNPNVSTPVHRELGGVPNVTLLDPVDYLTMVNLMATSHLILTDSGGIQEEAPSLHKPVLVLRNVTERPEGVAAGAARVIGCDGAVIVEEVSQLLDHPEKYARMANVPSPYGDGVAAYRVVEALRQMATAGRIDPELNFNAGVALRCA